MKRAGVTVLTCLLLLPPLAGPAAAQRPGDIRQTLERMEFEPIRFEPPVPELHTVAGVRVLFLEDHSLPLVDVLAYFRGGYGRFPRSEYAAAMGLSALIRNGGTVELTPDSLDTLMEFHAVQTVFGSSGESLTSSMNTLVEELPVALDLWGRLLREPRFDSARVETWRDRELGAVRRRLDAPTRLAYSEFNRLMYGDHPVGWEMEAADLEQEDVNPERLRTLHRQIVCPDNLVLGVTGDVEWPEIERLLEEWLADWPACPGELPPYPLPEIRSEPGVFLIPRPVTQSTVVMAHTSDVILSEDADYFASRVGNSILGASGLRSRIMSRVRTEEGLAYSGSSLWTAPRRGQGLLGVLTQTKAESTLAAIRVLADAVESMERETPTQEEVRTTIDEYANGFVFNFESASQIVARQMVYLAEDFPDDWLDRYLVGLQQVTPAQVLEVFRKHARPDEFVLLVVGDPERFDGSLESLGRGPVTVLDPGRPEG